MATPILKETRMKSDPTYSVRTNFKGWTEREIWSYHQGVMNGKAVERQRYLQLFEQKFEDLKSEILNPKKDETL